MDIPELKIADLTAKFPLVQGGMGVGISMANLAAAVANCGGVGVISGVEAGFYRPDYRSNKRQANLEALAEQIKKARQLSPSGVLGVNIMVAINDFAATVQTVIEAGIDIIFSGAGLPLQLPALAKNYRVKLAPIVSSPRAAALICKHWGRKHGRYPDAIVLEGPEAGGHLGFSEQELRQPDAYSLEKLVPATVAAIEPFEDKSQRPIPVIAAGGLWTGQDMARMFKLGAMGVQMATRFVPTHECDASLAFKKAYLDAQPDDIVLIKSPVGMIGRSDQKRFFGSGGGWRA